MPRNNITILNRTSETLRKMSEIDRARINDRGRSTVVLQLLPQTASEEIVEFYFPLSPVEVSYGNLADETAQIERPGTTPIIAFKQHRLMTVDLTFLLTYPYDGLIQSVDEDINILRYMALNTQRVVRVFGMDKLTKAKSLFRNASTELEPELVFTIVDLKIDSVRRTTGMAISQANVTLSLIENRNPLINVVYIPKMPKLVIDPKCKKVPKSLCKLREEKPNLIPKASVALKAIVASIYPNSPASVPDPRTASGG